MSRSCLLDIALVALILVSYYRMETAEDEARSQVFKAISFLAANEQADGSDTEAKSQLAQDSAKALFSYIDDVETHALILALVFSVLIGRRLASNKTAATVDPTVGDP